MRALVIAAVITLVGVLSTHSTVTAQSGSFLYPNDYVRVAPTYGREREAEERNRQRQLEEERRREVQRERDRAWEEQQRQWERQLQDGWRQY